MWFIPILSQMSIGRLIDEHSTPFPHSPCKRKYRRGICMFWNCITAIIIAELLPHSHVLVFQHRSYALELEHHSDEVSLLQERFQIHKLQLVPMQHNNWLDAGPGISTKVGDSKKIYISTLSWRIDAPC